MAMYTTVTPLLWGQTWQDCWGSLAARLTPRSVRDLSKGNKGRKWWSGAPSFVFPHGYTHLHIHMYIYPPPHTVKNKYRSFRRRTCELQHFGTVPLCCCQRSVSGWGNGSVQKVLVVQAWGPEFSFHISHSKSGVVVYTSNSSPEETALKIPWACWPTIISTWWVSI